MTNFYYPWDKEPQPQAFCEFCGAETVDEFTGKFDKNTGEKIMRKVCPKEPCEHTGHHLVNFVPTKFTQRYFVSPQFTCSRCNKPFSFRD